MANLKREAQKWAINALGSCRGVPIYEGEKAFVKLAYQDAVEDLAKEVLPLLKRIDELEDTLANS